MKVLLGKKALKKQLKNLEKKLELQQNLANSGSEQEKAKVVQLTLERSKY